MDSALYTFSFILPLLIHLGFAQNPSDTLASPTFLDLDGTLVQRTDRGTFAGVVQIAQLDGTGGRTLFANAYGAADRATSTPNTIRTLFITASTAKTFVSAGILGLTDQGRLNLDAPISRYLSDSVFPRRRGDSITVRQLLTHTAGLGDVVVGPAFRESPATLTHFDQLLTLVRDNPPLSSAGVFSYGNDDYILLGAIIEQISKKPFSDYMREAIFQRAGMQNTSYVMVPRPRNLAHGYTERNLGGPAYTPPRDSSNRHALHPNDVILPGVGVPGAVAYTTATDLIHFADALWSHRLLSENAVKALWTGQVTTGQGDRNPANNQYGLGFFVGTNGPNKIVNHGGTGPGIDVGLDIYPDLGYVVIVLANLDPPAAQDVRQLLREKFAKVSNR